MTWFLNDVQFDEPEEQHYGFVYQITNTQTNKKYIGKKLFWFKKTKVLKGKKKKYLAPSDWKTYYGSSVAVKKDVDALGEQVFKREILRLCKSKGECSYYEAKYQFDADVLKNPDQYYNDWIICRVHRKHIANC
jgi:hypothetical protein